MTQCIRCYKENEIPGFCPKCYLEVYALDRQDPIMIKLADLVPNDDHLKIVERDEEYTDEIRQSIIREGLKNPIIIDSDYKILIGHHRYFIVKELGWEEIPAYIVGKDKNYNKFIEGGLNNLFIVKLDGKLVASVMKVEDLLPIMQGWILRTPFWKTSYLNIECFTGIGGSNDPERWKERQAKRTKKLGGKNRL